MEIRYQTDQYQIINWVKYIYINDMAQKGLLPEEVEVEVEVEGEAVLLYLKLQLVTFGLLKNDDDY